MFKEISHLKTLVRADSSAVIGHGHIRRDLVLASHFRDISFACVRLKGDIFDEIAYPKFELSSTKISELIRLIDKEKFELLVVDSYDINFDDERDIKAQTGIKILSFDDYCLKHECDILLNVNPSASTEKYANLLPKNAKIWAGRDFMLVRDEFYSERGIKREKIYDYFVAFGGTDVLNLSTKVAQILLEKDAKIALVTTSSNPNLKELENLAKRSSNLTLFVDSKQIARLMNESKTLIIQASSFVNEALVLGANFIAVKTANNQNEIYSWLIENSYKAYESEQICQILS